MTITATPAARATKVAEAIAEFETIKSDLTEKFLALKPHENDLYVLTWRDSNLCVRLSDEGLVSACGVTFATTFRDEPTLDVVNGFHQKAVVTRLWNVYSRELSKVNKVIDLLKSQK